jgi:hypothetical protein
MSSSKKKAKMEQLRPDSVLELNGKNFGNSLSLPSVTQTTPFAQRFKSYEILNIDLAAESCF